MFKIPNVLAELHGKKRSGSVQVESGTKKASAKGQRWYADEKKPAAESVFHQTVSMEDGYPESRRTVPLNQGGAGEPHSRRTTALNQSAPAPASRRTTALSYGSDRDDAYEASAASVPGFRITKSVVVVHSEERIS